MTNKESIIAKITKLLALAGNNPNENERNAAMERAYKLLAEHNITMHDVKQSKTTEQKIAVETFHTSVSTRDENCNVFAGVCKLYYTSYYLSGGTISLYGTPENIQATIVMCKWLIDAIGNEARRQCDGRIAINNFKRGAAMGVYQNATKLVEQEQERAKTESQPLLAPLTPIDYKPGTQLMVIRNTLTKANQDYGRDVLKLRTVKRTSRRAFDNGAYNAGKNYGASLNLGRKMLNG